MPFIKKPRSDEERLTLLRRMAETGTQDHKEGREYLPAALLEETAALADTFEAALKQVDKTLAGRIKETAERRDALARLKSYVRDYWQGLARRTEREEHSVQVLRMHGLPADGPMPNPGRDEEWMVWAKRLIAGDARAVETGLPPMCNPTTAQVQAALDAAKTEAADVPAADRAYDEAQAALAELRAQVDDIIDQNIAYLQLALRKLDPPSQRRVLRTYGITYSTYKGETLPEEAELAAPPDTDADE